MTPHQVSLAEKETVATPATVHLYTYPGSRQAQSQSRSSRPYHDYLSTNVQPNALIPDYDDSDTEAIQEPCSPITPITPITPTSASFPLRPSSGKPFPPSLSAKSISPTSPIMPSADHLPYSGTSATMPADHEMLEKAQHDTYDDLLQSATRTLVEIDEMLSRSKSHSVLLDTRTFSSPSRDERPTRPPLSRGDSLPSAKAMSLLGIAACELDLSESSSTYIHSSPKPYKSYGAGGGRDSLPGAKARMVLGLDDEDWEIGHGSRPSSARSNSKRGMFAKAFGSSNKSPSNRGVSPSSSTSLMSARGVKSSTSSSSSSLYSLSSRSTSTLQADDDTVRYTQRSRASLSMDQWSDGRTANTTPTRSGKAAPVAPPSPSPRSRLRKMLLFGSGQPPSPVNELDFSRMSPPSSLRVKASRKGLYISPASYAKNFPTDSTPSSASSTHTTFSFSSSSMSSGSGTSLSTGSTTHESAESNFSRCSMSPHLQRTWSSSHLRGHQPKSSREVSDWERTLESAARKACWNSSISHRPRNHATAISPSPSASASISPIPTAPLSLPTVKPGEIDVPTTTIASPAPEVEIEAAKSPPCEIAVPSPSYTSLHERGADCILLQFVEDGESASSLRRWRSTASMRARRRPAYTDRDAPPPDVPESVVEEEEEESEQSDEATASMSQATVARSLSSILRRYSSIHDDTMWIR